MRHITVIITTQNLPPKEFNMIYCGNCGRPLMRVKGQLAAMVNSQGVSVEEIPVGIDFIEHKCHSCKSLNRIMIQ